MQVIDEATSLYYLIKRPNPEVRTYSVDFKKITASVNSAISVTAKASDLVTEVDPLVISDISISGTLLVFKVADGTDGEDYEVTCIIDDLAGNIISEDILIKVRKSGLLI